jgi:hypothetical protein
MRFSSSEGPNSRPLLGALAALPTLPMLPGLLGLTTSTGAVISSVSNAARVPQRRTFGAPRSKPLVRVILLGTCR